MLKTLKEVTAEGDIPKVLNSHQPNHVPKPLNRPEDPIWMFYKLSKRTEQVGWLEANVVHPEDFFCICRRSAEGPAMKVLYGHIHFTPRLKLATEMMYVSLEDKMKSVTMANLCDMKEL